MSEAHFGAVNTPVYRASTILFPDVASLKPGAQRYTYGRRGTPSSQSLEDAIGALESGAQHKDSSYCPSLSARPVVCASQRKEDDETHLQGQHVAHDAGPRR